MRSTTYSLALNAGYSTIKILNCKSKVRVYNLSLVPFTKTLDEIQFFGSYQGDILVFETENWVEAELDLVTAGIHWYADEILRFPEMDLSINDPRPPVKLRIVR